MKPISQAPDGRPFRVLVAEDEAIVSMFIEAELGDAGYEVIGAFSTCAEASHWLASDTPDIALLDHGCHAAGDELLVAVSGRLLATTSIGVTVARLGGAEFAIVGSPISGLARDLAEQVVVDLASRFLSRSGKSSSGLRSGWRSPVARAPDVSSIVPTRRSVRSSEAVATVFGHGPTKC